MKDIHSIKYDFDDVGEVIKIVVTFRDGTKKQYPVSEALKLQKQLQEQAQKRGNSVIDINPPVRR